MQQFNNGLIKPLTQQHSELPGLSYAVMRNLKRCGLRCSLFYSHAWNEGVFEFIHNALATWPDECEGAYICFLANPQNLDIGALVGGGVESSPFYRVLCSQPPPRMIMLANSITPIHGRWWCILEAFLPTKRSFEYTSPASRCTC